MYKVTKISIQFVLNTVLQLICNGYTVLQYVYTESKKTVTHVKSFGSEITRTYNAIVISLRFIIIYEKFGYFTF